MTNKLILRNETVIALDASGRRIISGHYPVEWTTSTGKHILWATGSENKLTWKPDDVCCCFEVCGECTEAVGDELTFDLGITHFYPLKFFSGYSCSPECENLEGEYTLTRVGDNLCYWRYTESFCRDVYTQPQDFTLQISARMFYFYPAWTWEVLLLLVTNGHNWGSSGVVKAVIYEATAGTDCTNITIPLTKVAEAPLHFLTGAKIANVCYTTPASFPDPALWEFPATADLILP